jgi:hypothetical protein
MQLEAGKAEPPSPRPVEAPAPSDNDTAAQAAAAEAAKSVVADPNAPVAEKVEPPKTDERKDDKPPEPQPSALERAKAAAAREKQRQAIRRQEQADRARMAAEAQTKAQESARYQAELAAERAERERLTALFEKSKTDPFSYLEAHGVTPEDIAKRAVDASTPEAQLAKVRADFEARLAKERETLRKEFEEKIQAREAAREEAEKRAQAKAVYEQATKGFVAQASDAAKYPTLARHAAVRPNAIVREAAELLAEAKQNTGVDYTDEEVLTFLEDQYSKAASDQPDPKAAAGKSDTAKVATETSIGTGTQAKKDAGAPRTLTNDDAAQVGTIDLSEEEFDKLSDLEQRRVMAAQLRKRTRG